MKIRPLDWTNDTELLQSELLDVSAVTVFVLVARRNAWHSTTSSRYDQANAIFTRLRSAEQAAEKFRKPGTWFTVLETPALRLDSESGSVLITDFHQTNPFGTWAAVARTRSHRDVLRPGNSLATVATRFNSRSQAWAPRVSHHSLIYGVVSLNDETRVAGTRRMNMFRSEVYDGWLDWTYLPEKPNRDRRGVRNIVRSFRRNSAEQSSP